MKNAQGHMLARGGKGIVEVGREGVIELLAWIKGGREASTG
jgi:hypothetical protein